MPNLDPVRKYQPLDPYHHVADNQPIIDLEQNAARINDLVETHHAILTSAIGTQGSVAVRLNQSINPDGTLKAAAVDQAGHGISYHTDGGGFVRMTDLERSKLAGVASASTDLKVRVVASATSVLYDTGVVALKGSNSVVWRNESDGVYADVTFPLTARHRHYYDVKPTPVNSVSPDYQTYHTTSVATAYAAGSLRVHVNGVRISHADPDPAPPADVKFPRHSGSVTTWVSLNFSEDPAHVTAGVVTTGTFTLSAPVLATDRLTIDFDTVLT